MKRIIVTGAKGGAGRSIVKVLREAGYNVLGIDLKPAEPTETGYVRHDILDGAGLHDLFAGADGVVHFGSYPTTAWSSWSETFHNVTDGGFNVFQACANLGIKRIAWASSMEVYGYPLKLTHLPLTEDSPLMSPDIYGASKVMLESLAADYCRWHSMSIAGFRLGRIVYEGGFDWRLKKHTESDESAADVLWCYIDARDVATACQAWLESDLQGFMPFNVAAEDVCVETPTKQLLERFYPNVGLRASFDGHQCPYDASALQRALGWKPRYDWRTTRDEFYSAGN
ncbi:MAG: NAD(P)-dependent oxidoreductase [Candidatus Poribacteria bacterium]|nr:NAD(P)-dependent oxidoreductase [Candidatus Poribacteria bacterium]